MCPLNQLCAPRHDGRDGKKRGPSLFPYFLVHVFICFEENNLSHPSSIRIILAFPDLCFSPWLSNVMAKLPFPTIMFQSYQSNVALPLPAWSFSNYPNIGIGEWRGINSQYSLWPQTILKKKYVFRSSILYVLFSRAKRSFSANHFGLFWHQPGFFNLGFG